MTSRFRPACRLLAALAIGAPLASASAHALARSSPPLLRVCSDPNNLPFSSRAQPGFENRVAQILARDLGYQLEYYWWPQRRGFLRNTLSAGHCDVVMGLPVGTDRARTTRPYYRSSYVFVQRRASPRITSLDDPGLRSLRIAIQLVGDDADNPPPAHALARRGLVGNLRGFPVYGDYSSPDPERPIVQAVADGSVDLAIVWGPLAGYYARQSRPALQLWPVRPEREGRLHMSFAIALGVRRDDVRLERLLNRALARRSKEIERVLDSYGVPRLGLPP